MLDTVVTAETPEGILLELRPAGLSARFYAFCIDWLIRLAVLYAALIAVSLLQMSGLGFALLAILMFALEWFYPVVFELGRSGATPGKRVFGLRVVMDNGLPITPARLAHPQSAARRGLPAAASTGSRSSACCLRKDCKRLGDIAAATLVVHDSRPAPKIELHQVEPIAPARPLSPADQSAVIALAARAPTLTGERLDELAALAAPVSGDDGRSGPEVTRRVLGVAHVAAGEARVTPLQFEQLYQAEWQELEQLLATVIRPEATSKKAQARPSTVSASQSCIGAPASTWRSRAHAPIPPICIDRLERLTSDAHQVIYQHREFGLARIKRFCRRRFPARGPRARGVCVDRHGRVRACRRSSSAGSSTSGPS